jgi:hypothetical protein
MSTLQPRSRAAWIQSRASRTPMGSRPGESHALGEPLGQAADAVAGPIRDSRQREGGVDLAFELGPNQVGEGAVEAQEAAHAHPRRKPQALRQVADADPRGGILGRKAAHAQRALIRGRKAEQEAQDRGLAGAVGAEQPEGRARRQRKAHPAERVAPPEVLRHASEVEGRQRSRNLLA